ncbi:FAD/NAD(P)-binding protein [Rhizobium sp. C4]|uniref:FAD/NAD(P)-binding protein n=1 Tax=Rhizobium sp. C4 TaxID=1349800 RepID=UPI001E3428E6|nr:FAD/NAD(P)-binding protein [Rhizobium sp. C4]MCD2172476.1 FAD/NAD(P)-binding protein [Rhizobium sp. C4]
MTHHIVIAGGGASGAIMAANLFRLGDGALRVTLVEASGEIGKGLAYSTNNPSHLFNVRAAQLSAFSGTPDHFERWLAIAYPQIARNGPFVPRGIYGEYLEAALRETAPVGKFRVLSQACVGMRQLENGVEVTLADGSSLPAHFAVVATGFGMQKPNEGLLSNPWNDPLPEDKDARVLIVGTGLTMVDTVLSLLDNGHRGKIIAVSRRGLLSQRHALHRPLQLSTADIPLGASIHYLSRWLTDLVRTHVANGGDWRDVMDGMRPHIQAVWRYLPTESRQRFLRHAAAFWDIHRHRMPPAQAERIDAVLESGQLEIVKGRFVSATRCGTRLFADIVRSGWDEPQPFKADVIYDCRGVRRRADQTLPGLPGALVEAGAARLEKLGLGLEFDRNCALVNREGEPSARIFGIGPVTLGTFWESIAVPDIREQARLIAEKIASGGRVAPRNSLASLP